LIKLRACAGSAELVVVEKCECKRPFGLTSEHGWWWNGASALRATARHSGPRPAHFAVARRARHHHKRALRRAYDGGRWRVRTSDPIGV